MNTGLKAITQVYRGIFKRDGLVSEDELFKMLEADEYIPPSHRNKETFMEIADRIYASSNNKWEEINENRMQMYRQGMTLKQMAAVEGKDVQSLYIWFRTRGINLKKAE